MMRIAVASGKGGTGKTTVACNMAVIAERAGYTTAYLDCDVEEPNGALFLRPQITETRPVHVSIPMLIPERCTGCGRCVDICRYNAITRVNHRTIIFPELCHGCGGCHLACPNGAITETHRQTGTLSLGEAAGIRFIQGTLDIGEAMSPPVISAVRDAAPDVERLVIDAPPGTSCPVIESIRNTDFVILVTEPTPFGLNDLKLAVELVRILQLPFGVVINRAGLDDNPTEQYCLHEQIDVLARIPDDRVIAEAYSRGELAVDAIDSYRSILTRLLAGIDHAINKPALSG